MTWRLTDLSIFGGRPVELFRFVYGVNRYCFTSSDADVSYQGESYKATPMERTGISIAHDISKADITITVPRDNKLAALYVGPPPDDVISLTVFSYHKGDGDFVVLWQGRVTSVMFAGSTASITCEPVFTSLRRPGLRAMYQRLCRHELYSSACGVQSESYKVVYAGVVSYSGVTLTLPVPLAAGWATGGLLTTSRGAKRWVLAQNGAVLTLNNAIIDLNVDEPVTVYAGCDCTRETCNAKFGNILNFGGFPWVPYKNPFAGDPIM
jgi:uncharacterized phage protein (TIGR02218 family)